MRRLSTFFAALARGLTLDVPYADAAYAELMWPQPRYERRSLQEWDRAALECAHATLRRPRQVTPN